MGSYKLNSSHNSRATTWDKETREFESSIRYVFDRMWIPLYLAPPFVSSYRLCLFAEPFARQRSCPRLRESLFTARLERVGTRGVNEEPQVARKGRPFSPPVVTQSADRPTHRPGRRPRLSRSYAFSCRHYIRSIYGRRVGGSPINHGRLELRPYDHGNKPREQEWVRERERREGRKRGLRGWRIARIPLSLRSGDITARWVIHVRASEQLPSDDATN